MLCKRPHFFLLAVLLSVWPATALSQEKAQLPYSMVSSYQELFKSLQHLDLISPSIIILSTDPQVAPTDILFKIKLADDWQNFSPDENGVIEFPDQPDWQNLNLISNQPKGTLQLVIGFKARQLSSTTTTYQQLMGLVPQFKEAMAALATMQGQPAPELKGLTIQLPEEPGGTVSILSKKRETTLKASSAGMVVMKYKQALWDENPAVEFSKVPVGIIPLQ
ncbi:MAG: hypothetical protein OET46_03060 [Xanthomonadales bacterium]|nr:hypothetical protein [Xanthomonadales bacterium]